MRSSRRTWLKAAAAAGLMAQAARGTEPEKAPVRVAAIVTEFTYRSHAHVILENFLEPYLFNGRWIRPPVRVTGMYVDQFPAGRDMAREVARTYGIPLHDSIAGAMTEGGTELAVEAVLSIGEIGDYPDDAIGRKQYPRKRFFDAIAAVVRRAGRPVPVFNDKHLSYRFDWAREMVETARELKIPLMAGSSVPLAVRRPEIENPTGLAIEEAVSLHGGGLESYGFHGLEVLQAMIEGRAGGETGVAEVTGLEGEAVWRAAADGRWNEALARAALEAELGSDPGPLREYAERSGGGAAAANAILVRYRDGLRAAVLRIVGGGTKWQFAARVRGRKRPVVTTHHVGPWDNRNLFKALSHAIQSMFTSGRPAYPAERTLLTTGITSAAMESLAAGGAARATPELAFGYAAVDYGAFRERGGSWKVLTEATPEPRGLGTGLVPEFNGGQAPPGR